MASILDTPCPTQSTRMLTGIEGLDQICRGGFIRGNSILIQGPPGSAKTTIGIQTLINGCERFGERGIVLSLEQQPSQILRDARSFGWNLSTVCERNDIRLLFVRPQDLYRSLTSEDSRAVAEVRKVQEAIGARRILVDSITHFYRTQHPLEEQDQVFSEFIETLRQFGLTPLLIAEQSERYDALHTHPAYVADTVLNLHYEYDSRAGFRRRWLEVIKSRGQGCIEGRHPFRFTDRGIQVFPRVAPSPQTIEPQEPRETCSTGVPGMDALIGGGVARGSIGTVAGPEGTAKTTLGAHFLAAGCMNDETGLLVTFQETPGQLLQNMTSRGLDLAPFVRKGKLEILHLPSIGLCLLETYYRLREIIVRRGVRRVVIDSVSDLLRNSADSQDEHYFMSIYCDLFRTQGVTTVFLEQIRPSSGLEAFAAVGHASMVDTIILVNFAEIAGRLAKSIVVMKSRNAIADARFHELVLTPQGAQVRSQSGRGMGFHV